MRKNYFTFINKILVLTSENSWTCWELMKEIQSKRKISVRKWYEDCYLHFWSNNDIGFIIFQNILHEDKLLHALNQFSSSFHSYWGNSKTCVLNALQVSKIIDYVMILIYRNKAVFGRQIRADHPSTQCFGRSKIPLSRCVGACIVMMKNDSLLQWLFLDFSKYF